MERKTLTIYLSSFIDELSANGIKDVVISPGSRSTPLAMLFAENRTFTSYVHVDERSAAYFGLGIAKKTKRPVVLVCTSGTAAANYYPAICEAHESRVPLIVITADRPHELREVGAPQTMNQIGLYSSFVKLFIDAAIPEEHIPMYYYVRTLAARSCSVAMTKPYGPVHINMPLREPLVPNLDITEKWIHRRRYDGPCVTFDGVKTLTLEQKKALQDILKNTEKGLIVCGANENEYEVEPILTLAQRLGFPILVDPLSKMRSGSHRKDLLIESYDTFLRHEELVEALRPDTVIRFGAMPVSKFLTQFLSTSKCRTLVIDEGNGWRDPLHHASYMIQCNPEVFCQEMSEISKPIQYDYLSQWRSMNDTTKELLLEHLDEKQHIEGAVIVALQESLLPNANVFVGNSMPIRDIDTFFYCTNKEITLYGNRGVNGIDGIVSTALGVATQGEPVVLVMGDVSFFHDLNGLIAAKLYRMNVTIIVINNDGGGIFSFLPQASEPKHFEKVFGTPLGLDYRQVVEMHGGRLFRPENMEEFTSLLTKCQHGEGLHVIEVMSNRDENLVAHRQLWNKVLRELYRHEKALH